MCPLSLSKGSSLFPALFSPHHRVLFSFSCTLFHFLDHSYPASFPQFAHSSAKNRGYTPTWSYHGSSLSTVDCRLSASLGPLLLSPLFPLHTNTGLVCRLFPLLTQKQGEEVSLAKILFCGLACFGYSLKNVGAPTFLIFPLIFRTFLAPSAAQRVARHPPASEGGRYKTEEGGLKPPLQRKRGTDHGTRRTPHPSLVAGHWPLNGVESGRETRSKL
jgi:hypothetical protein